MKHQHYPEVVFGLRCKNSCWVEDRYFCIPSIENGCADEIFKRRHILGIRHCLVGAVWILNKFANLA